MRRAGLGGAIASGALALLLGAVAFAPLFVPLFAGSFEIAAWHVEAIVLAVAGRYFVFGLAIGYVNPRFWLVAGVLAWVAVLSALYNLAYALGDPSYPRGAAAVAVLVIVVPLLAALTGAHVGRGLALRRPAG